MTKNCSNCQSELAPGARFCMHCGQPVILSTPVDEGRYARLAAAAPDPLVDKVLAAEHLVGERKSVTALLVDVVGSTALAEQLDVETWTEIMNRAFDRIAPAIYRYEGTIARLLGDSLLAFFGAPMAHEDDPVRAVNAALDVLAVAREYAEEVREGYGVEFAMRASINSGPVIIGQVGDDLKYDYTATGGAVNLTSRIKFAAQPMSVLISSNTYRFVAPIFECDDLGDIDVKGRAEPVRVYRVLGVKERPGSLRGLAGLESPMVGRDIELGILHQLCETVRAGLGRAVLIVGEPGLGKTRLITEWRAEIEAEGGIPASVWAEGRCLSYGQGLAYHLLTDLLRSLVGVPEADEEPETRAALLAFIQDLFGDDYLEVYPYLGHLLSLHLEGEARERLNLSDPQALQIQYLEAMRKLLVVLASRSPVILILEDLHWADPSSTELLTRLLPLVFTAPLLFCLVTRLDHDAPGWRLVSTAREQLGGGLHEITLNALSESDSRELVSNLLEIEALPEEVRSGILKKAEGNPFFVEEVIRMLIDRRAIVRKNGDWVAGERIGTVEIPDNLQGLLLARIDRLPEEAKEALRVAAVIGRQFPVKVLAQVLGRSAE
jgi:class 3 adenylate cyclase